jgi:plastocyanin
MRHQRVLALATAGVLGGALLVGCVAANPGWTYQPAPSVTAAPSVEPSAEASPSSGSGGVAITASGIAFQEISLSVPAGKAFQIEFTNNDAGTPHNIAIHKGDASGPEVFKGEIFPGVDTKAYDVPALDAGAYTFACTVHPTMVGTMTAQ